MLVSVFPHARALEHTFSQDGNSQTQPFLSPFAVAFRKRGGGNKQGQSRRFKAHL